MDAQDYQKLEEAIGQVWDIAISFGLDPFPVHFEVVPATIMYEFGAYGLPGRFSHWTHGRAYQQMKTMYDYGLSKIYELVINTNPSYAFLMESNSLLQNKLVAAHVLGHSDFFKNNAYFAQTNRHMIEGASVNADRIRGYEFEHGSSEVEQFLDAVLSIDEHVDPNGFIGQRTAKGSRRDHEKATKPRLSSTPYDDLLSLDKQVPPEKGQATLKRKFPEEPTKDLLLFIATYAPDLEDWQRDIIHMVRSEMLYFVPQMQTKIMNEGWAAYWHARIMRELNLPENEYLDFAEMHSSVLAPTRRQINPYYVGMKIFEDIEKRWDRPTEEEQRVLKRPGGQGREKIFEVRSLENDVSFLRNYLTKDLVDKLDLYIYELRNNEWVIVEKDWQKVRDMIVDSMTNFGRPYIVVEDADFNRNGELLLVHKSEGKELDQAYAEKTLEYVYRLWGRTVHLVTPVDGKKVTLTYNGRIHSRSS